MLQTPATFQPLISPQDHDQPITFVFHRGELLLRNNIMGLPAPDDLSGLPLAPERIHPLGLWEGRYYQAAWLDEQLLPDAAFGYHGLRSLFGVLDDGFLGLAGRAFQLVEWARTHRYCGVCATPMQLLAGERCYKCPHCGHSAYPRISPAMMVLVRKGDQVLLAMHTNSPYKRYTALAGFVEAGESVEEAIHREVFEEVGLKVHNLQYFGSQSWPFPHSLMIAYTAEYLDGEIRVDQNEIAEARWFGAGDEWPELPVKVSIAARLIDAHRPR
ncbi:NAD(+) diphosphatase [Duganella sp. FT134W]|uniref:NAD(+) diphosphatase n=1 Tax=Duganella margarita TaxID=2692170 RepID=A0A7X4H7T5_9BURK|nr:NAD(+) diphosphatase [Duganella margarita]MYM75929.1 NAD(+) diphosphatase [Duganella margarita]